MTKSNAKNLSKTVLMLLSVSALVLTAGPTLAQPGPGGGWGGGRGGHQGKMRGKRMEKLKAALNLSDAQVQQIKAIHAGQKAQGKQLRQQLKPLHQQLKALLSADVINESQALAVHNQLKSIKQVMGEQRFKTRLQVMRVLTKEQRVKMISLRAKGKHGKWGKRGQRGMRGQGGQRGMRGGWGGNPQPTVD